MYSNTVPQKQLIPWLTAGLIPVTLQLGAGVGWVAALLTALVCGLLISWVWSKGAIIKNPILAIAQFLVMGLVLSQFLGASAQAWPGGNYPAVPLLLLALCVWTCQKGASVAARVGCVLFWVVLILYPLVMLMGAGQMKWNWLSPYVTDIPWETAILLLLPAAAVVLRERKQRWVPGLCIPGAVYVAGSVIVIGALSLQVAQNVSDPFYTMSQSVDIMGIAQRFDAVISAGMTVGWYALVCLLLSLAAAWMECACPRRGKVGLWTAAILSAVGMLCKLHISCWILAVLATVFWVIIPILTQGLVGEKKS